MDKTEFPWAISKNQIVEELQVDPQIGLSENEVQNRKNQFGLNSFHTEKVISSLALLLKQFTNPMTYTLFVATAVAVSLGEMLNAIAIFAIVILNALIGFFQESKAEASIQALKKLSVPKARVLRDKKVQIVPSVDVVPGDILKIEAGDYIVADARIVESYQVKSDEAVLTGESLPVSKNDGIVPRDSALADRINMLYASTAVAHGSGKAIVVSTGMQTEIGKIAGLLQTTVSAETPLQEKLSKVSTKLLILGVVVIILVMAMGVMKGETWFSIFMTGISLAVAAIPEGLPTIVTLALTLGVRRMTKRNAIIRKLSAVETLGSADVICTDKTGTLTSGEMTVREVYNLEEKLKNKNDFTGSDLFYKCMIHCNNANVKHGKSGDPTEVALLLLSQEKGIDLSAVKAAGKKVHEWSFDSIRKRMSVAIEEKDSLKLYCKGAPESILPLCINNSNEISENVQKLSEQGRRTLAMAYREMNQSEIQLDAETVERNLVFLGVVGIADPPKEEAKQSILDCQASGIKVVMITGDHPVTARAIARELNIVTDGDEEVVTGVELDKISVAELSNKIDAISVYARVSPQHKLKIVEAMQSRGHIVAMTGDGVNDAPALKKASIGVAMGKAGTEVARQASSMVLTDDNFSSIVAAVEEGRAIHGNIKRTIQYLLSTNLAEILIMFISVVMGLPLPLNPINLLWINLVTDGFPALALAAEPIEKGFLHKNTRPSSSSFFDEAFIKELLIVALIMTAMSISGYYWVYLYQDALTAKSYIFNFLVYLILMRSFTCRSEITPYFKLKINYYHLFSIIIPIALQMYFQHFQVVQTVFEIKPLPFYTNIWLFSISTIPFLLIELLKLRHYKKLKD